MTQARLLIALACLAALFASGLYLGRKWEQASQAQDAIKTMGDRMAEVLDEQAESAERQRSLQRTLDRLPRAEGKIREVVRDNPAPCDRPGPVADSLRTAIREANAARKVPGDS